MNLLTRRTLMSHSAMARSLPLWVLPLPWLVAFNTNLPVVAQAPDVVGIVRAEIDPDRSPAVRRQIPSLSNRRPETDERG